jgi:hypothetical protein
MRKIPADVYDRLVRCYAHFRRIAIASRLKCLDLRTQSDSKTAPSDVYDIASLLVSELAYVNAQLPKSRPAPQRYYSGDKVPSDVYQRVGILEAQLTALADLVEHNLDWLDDEA